MIGNFTQADTNIIKRGESQFLGRIYAVSIAVH